MNNQDLNMERLQAALNRRSTLTFEQAQAQIPALAMAELAGDDVDTTFAEVFAAFDQYPALAEEYFALMEMLTAELNDPAPAAEPARVPQFFAEPSKQAAWGWVQRWGAALQNLLITVLPQPAPQLGTRTLGNRLEYVSGTIPQTAIDMTLRLESRRDQQWELVVAVSADTNVTWDIGVSINDQPIPQMSKTALAIRFGPLTSVPTEPIIVTCRSIDAL